MADQPVANAGAKPADAKARPQAAAVIRRMAVTQEDARERLLKRQLPAWVISGAFHLVFMVLFVVFFSGETAAPVEANDNLVETVVEDKAEEPEQDLTNPDMGFESDLAAATEADREEPENVEAPVVPEEAIGSPSETSEAPTQTLAPPGANEVMPNAGTAVGPEGTVKAGDGGAGGSFATPGMRGRSGATKDALLKSGGGNQLSEAAVARGLEWLARQQKPDGRWVYDGSSAGDTVAATGMALLPFLAAGQTHKSGAAKSGKNYSKKIALGLEYLKSRQQPSGDFTGASSMYSTAIAAVALCEAYGMTKDPSLKRHAQSVLNFIMKGQGNNGSWGYRAGSTGDTSIVGWQIQALKSGKIADLTVSDEIMKRANSFLDTVSTESGARYGYTSRGGTPSLTAVGLLCRQYSANWGPNNPALAAGVDFLVKGSAPQKGRFDMYVYYYATQVVHFYGGAKWSKDWNPKMRDMLIDMQVKLAGPDQGSWAADTGSIGSHCGRLGTTCLALLTLEVYYRHLPLYKRDAGGLKDLD
ncbi:prenyltransferase/squalene oxidase repeat-containing protein [Tuwongella immobilis]|uniref:Squalene cyclase C-terminal domain-containing protein n=1 Tax=Tuwongella immobilis TaxID=692036 RepID=A0A6C2YNH1_9BACT|nr:terpene cyclase/mutase family protein [Tuwongella immobilis]VIP03170.1 Uncharacterized protein OS=Blastopirellula marina DSM 3645 GN=DSM3645_18766 PE=4 SV=1: Prenyltrans_2 [Tuwongella immobilis]VTS03597.1 Uncharacterized protein OS=Blastopirellula marina DSM 3645 GN=DSM3645_18766 PE=4 SV=1: Prenyltrans_2 [Tuwongella immobilis]